MENAPINSRAFRVRRQIAAVVGRALLVAERLEPLLEVPIEGGVEFVRLHLERFFVRVFAAADHALPEREHELPDAFLAPLLLDELEQRVAQVVRDEARAVRVAVPFGLAHLRHDIRHGGVADVHQIHRRPLRALDLGAAFGDPEGIVPPDERLRNDVELELMHQLVDDEAVQPVRRLVDRHDHPLAHRLGKRADAFRRLAEDVFLFELAVRLEQDQLHFERAGRASSRR